MDLTDEEQKTLEFYEKEGVDWAARRREPTFWLDEIAEFQQLLPKGKILEVGCGVGLEAELLAELGYQYVGTDIAKAFVAEAKRLHPKLKFAQASAYELPFGDQEFDGFITIATLIHVPKAKLGVALGEIKRVTKPGGYGFIVIKEGSGEELDYRDRFTSFYQATVFTQLLEEHGFSVSKSARRPADPSTWLEFWVQLEP
jgi:ubiquinone/menaquinone biosynthesis C-methylase UbiE